MKKIIDYFKSWEMDKWAHFGVGGLICAVVTLVFLCTLNPIQISWGMIFAPFPGLVLVGILSTIKELTDPTGFCLPDIVAGLIGCIPVEIAMILGIIVGLLSV